MRTSAPSNFYTTPQRQRTQSKGTISADNGYSVQKSREERLPRDAKSDHVLSGASELMNLLAGQPTIVKQNVVDRVAKLKATPKVNTVRTIIMQEVQRVERES